jgi:hypothetical protein
MKKVRFSGLAFLSALLLLSIFCGCKKEETWPQENDVTVYMTNSTDEYTHMWTTGETMNGGNKLVPWLSREKYVTLTYESAESTPTLSVAAGREGQELKRISTTVPYKQDNPQRCYYANFRNSGIIEFGSVNCKQPW